MQAWAAALCYWLGPIRAAVSANADRLGDILANDWVEMRWYGVAVKKMQALADLKAPGNSLDSFEMGPVNVRVFGNTAIVTGSDTEKAPTTAKTRVENMFGQIYF